MNQIDKTQILKMAGVILLIFVAVGTATYFNKKNSMTLDEYAKNHPDHAGQSTDASNEGFPAEDGSDNAADSSADSDSASNSSENSSLDENTEESSAPVTTLTGALLNGGADGMEMLEERVTYRTGSGVAEEEFYYEPLSENLQRYITGISYPAVNRGDFSEQPDIAITYDELRYVHVLHYDFDGTMTEGELICNAAIADDLLDIFYELYRNEYQIEKIRLIDEYNGDDTASMEDNNTSCFNYRVVEGSTSLSKHAYGLAIDVNPFYNPYITYNGDGTQKVSPAAAEAYADRNINFPYKIDESDLCYKLFVQHGFTWGGNWNSSKDYQHFQKTP